MSLLDDFKVRFANDSKLDLVAIENDWASLDPVWQCYYCEEYGADSCTDEAIFQLIAHMWLIESKPNPSPNKGVASKSWGSESTTYAQVDGSSRMEDYFNSTVYGQRFYQITRSNRGVFFV